VANPIRWKSRILLGRAAIVDWLRESNVHVTIVEVAYGWAELCSPPCPPELREHFSRGKTHYAKGYEVLEVQRRPLRLPAFRICMVLGP
jgi:hypothetical protein